jgi:hypothetical protein
MECRKSQRLTKAGFLVQHDRSTRISTGWTRSLCLGSGEQPEKGTKIKFPEGTAKEAILHALDQVSPEPRSILEGVAEQLYEHLRVEFDLDHNEDHEDDFVTDIESPSPKGGTT